jgi:hypothetical protein
MMPYQAHQVCEAARSRTDAERRAADVRLGEMAATVSELWRDVIRPVRALRSLRHHQGEDSWAGGSRI